VRGGRGHHCNAEGSRKESKYKCLCTAIERIWNTECMITPVLIGATGVAKKTFKETFGSHYLSNTPKKCTYIVFNNPKFTLKHLKRSYMFRFNVNFRLLKALYVHLLMCYLNKLQNARCNDEDIWKAY
jgi:hypothetical protein